MAAVSDLENINFQLFAKARSCSISFLGF